MFIKVLPCNSRAMMFGGLQESHQTEVEIKDANLTAFKILLKYIYKGFISLHNENVSYSPMLLCILVFVALLFSLSTK